MGKLALDDSWLWPGWDSKKLIRLHVKARRGSQRQKENRLWRKEQLNS